jgi:hypothetical protein
LKTRAPRLSNINLKHHKGESIMPFQHIETTISANDLQAIKDAFATIKQKLPFLVNLTSAERQGTFKTGPDRVSFVQNALLATQAHPDILPASFSTTSFQKDVALFASLSELQALADSLASQIDDTRLAVGGDSITQATDVYNFVKRAARSTPGLKPLAQQLGEQFKKASRAKEPEKTAA